MGLCYQNILLLSLSLLWLSRDVALIFATWYHVKTGTEDLKELYNPGKTPFKVKPTNVSKANTVFQFLTLGCGMAHFYVGNEILLSSLCHLSAGTTILSGLFYLDGKSLTS